jgi:putative transport protein
MNSVLLTGLLQRLLIALAALAALWAVYFWAVSP